jgi:acyl-coenzyme A thioesterase 9
MFRALSRLPVSRRLLSTETPTVSVGKFQNPIVEQLWSLRSAATSVKPDPSNPYFLKETPRPPSHSATNISYPFSSNPFLSETYKSPWGTIRIGKILEDLDALAGNIAFKHCVSAGSWKPPLIVTAGIDRIRVKTTPAVVDGDQLLYGSISWVGKSSMEITMKVKTEGTDKEWLEARFTFVARDRETGRATDIVPLAPSGAEEEALFERGRLAAEHKKLLRSQGRDLSSDYNQSVHKLADDLLAKGKVVKNFPSLSNADQMLMYKTGLDNAFIPQPQQRNTANSIFGGFLMRRAFELAFANAYKFGGLKPKFIEVDDISFLNPVSVGELLLFHSRVLYTLPKGGSIKLDGENCLVMVEVTAHVTCPENVTSKLSNSFNFTFSLSGKSSVKEIVPGDDEEAVAMAKRIIADVAQLEEDKRSEAS